MAVGHISFAPAFPDGCTDQGPQARAVAPCRSSARGGWWDAVPWLVGCASSRMG